jgi:hypothetical protein
VGGGGRPDGPPRAWIVAPWLSHHLGGRDPFIEALLICFNAGLLWMLVLTLILVRRGSADSNGRACAMPSGSGRPRIRRPDARAERSGCGRFPSSSSLLPWSWHPIDPTGPLPRDLPKATETDRVEHFFSGAWGWFALAVLVVFLAPLVEELLFRGLLLPRMRAAFGKRDWVANGTLFTLYHVHQPWSMPATLLDGIFAAAYPTKRYRSTWMGIITHTMPSFIITGIVLSLVLK